MKFLLGKEVIYRFNAPMTLPDPAFQSRVLEALKKGAFSDVVLWLANPAEHPDLFPLPALLWRGLAEIALKEWAGASHAFKAATEAQPSEANLWFNYGVALENLDQADEAMACFDKALSLRISPALKFASLLNLSNLHRKKGHYKQAEMLARRALSEGSPEADTLNALGLALGRQRRFLDADACFQKALDLAPDNPLFWLNRANLYVDEERFDKAWPAFATARKIADQPLVRRDEGLARLLAGDFVKGWDLYEARLDVSGALPFSVQCPRYKGEELKGKKLLILSEQGFGDTIHFCRFDNKIREAGAEPVWAVQPALVRLLQASLKSKVVSRDELLPKADFYVPLLSLPKALRHYEPFFTAPYLIPPAKKPVLSHREDKIKVGLVWSGSPTHARDADRTIPLSAFKQLMDTFPEAQFFAPTIGPAVEDIKKLQLPIGNLAPLIHDFGDTATLLSQMDVLVTVDTAAAHLAGAMGMKAYVLLYASPDWRWGTKGETTPWYPSLTLLRQKKVGEWGDVIEELRKRLITV